MNPYLKLALSTLIGGILFAGFPATAAAQTDPGEQIIASLDLDSVDVREALRALFKNVGVSYSIAPEVQGTVTVNMKNVRFDTALQNILRQVEATYRVEGGVYQIIKRELVLAPSQTPGDTNTPTSNKVRRKVYVRHIDPMHLAGLIGRDKGQTSFTSPPEMSTVINTANRGGGGFGGGGGRGGNGGFGGGGFGGGSGGGFGGGGFGGGGFGGGGYGGGGRGGGGGGGGRGG